jgi:histidyl-tRNA synthetase
MAYRSIRGTRDILPGEVEEWQFVEGVFRDVCRRYCYSELRTPVFEQTELFVRSVGEETDIVQKEMYTFEDRGGRSLTLRTEGTAPVVRAYVQHSLQGQAQRLVKLYYIVPIYRYDRPQKGRLREHHQTGMEAIGSQDPAVDAEIIDLALTYWREIGISGCQVMLNSVGCPQCWPGYVEQLQSFVADKVGEMCADCGRRHETNMRRILDCKNEKCRELTEGAPTQVEHLCDECGEHFDAVQASLKAMQIEYELDARIVRGLDYYTKTAFEVVHDALGAQDSIGGGGRYDGLVADCGGKRTPGVGAGLGLDRALLVREALGVSAAVEGARTCFIVTVGDDVRDRAVALASELRRAGVSVDMARDGKSLRSQLREADGRGFRYSAILGEDELARGVVSLRCMNTGEQREVAMEALARELKAGQRSD